MLASIFFKGQSRSPRHLNKTQRVAFFENLKWCDYVVSLVQVDDSILKSVFFRAGIYHELALKLL